MWARSSPEMLDDSISPQALRACCAPSRACECWWAGRESNPHSRRRLIYSQRSSPPAQPTHVRRGDGPRLRSRGGPGTDGRRWSRRRDSNPEPAVYKTAALPIELRRRGAGPYRRRTLRRRGMIRSGRLAGQARRTLVSRASDHPAGGRPFRPPAAPERPSLAARASAPAVAK